MIISELPKDTDPNELIEKHFREVSKGPELIFPEVSAPVIFHTRDDKLALVRKNRLQPPLMFPRETSKRWGDYGKDPQVHKDYRSMILGLISTTFDSLPTRTAEITPLGCIGMDLAKSRKSNTISQLVLPCLVEIDLESDDENLQPATHKKTPGVPIHLEFRYPKDVLELFKEQTTRLDISSFVYDQDLSILQFYGASLE